jgi:phosphoserine phosphatase
MKKLYLATVIFCLISPISNAEIIEKTKLADFIDHADKDTLLIFDIDSTVVEPVQMLGGDAWFWNSLQKELKEGKNKEDALNTVIKPWLEAQKVTDVHPVEPNTASVIKRAQESGIKVMALTSRPHQLAETTLKQLHSVSVDFTLNPPLKKDMNLGADFGRYISGIIFAANLNGDNFVAHNKGAVLVKFLNKLKYNPKKIMFIDDRKKNINNVDEALNSRNIPNLCIRYGAADAQYKTFDVAVADMELYYLGKLMPDKAAKHLAKQTPKNK